MFDQKVWRKSSGHGADSVADEEEDRPRARVLHFPSVGGEMRTIRELLSTDEAQRLLLGLCGSTLAVLALRRRSLGSFLLGLVGGALALRAALGTSDVAVERQRVGKAQSPVTWPNVATDSVGEASAESFPASDAPAWTSTTGTHPRGED